LATQSDIFADMADQWALFNFSLYYLFVIYSLEKI
jgi:cbb3-type cytochrome oxidase subunit 3